MDTIVKVINKAKQFLDRECGVIDERGIIYATTNNGLQNAEDKNAINLIRSDANFLVTSNNTYIKIEDPTNYVWLAYVQGGDQVAHSYVNLLAEWLKSELDDKELKKNRESLLKNVLLENELPGDIPLKVRDYKISFNARRIVYEIFMPHNQAVDYMPYLREEVLLRQDYALIMDEHTIVILKEIHRDENFDVEEYAKKLLSVHSAEAFPSLAVGIGMPVDNLRDCAKSYREASLALTVGNIFEETGPIRRYDKLGLSRLIYQLPATLCQMFLNEVFPKNTYESLDAETLLTIERFFENNLNGSETSRQLFVHRNTLVYRLDKVQKITGLDLRNFDDAVIFKLAAMVRKYLESLPNNHGTFINHRNIF